MIDVDQAQRILLDNIAPGETETVPLREALFRTLAQPIPCDIDYPPFDRSVMDGYAVRAADVADAPVELHIVGQVAAGTTADTALRPGQTLQINTGAPIPSGADAVVRVESTELSAGGESVTVQTAVKQGTFITRRATYVTAGNNILEAHTRITPLEIGAAAAAGAARVTVYRRPTVAILVTGDELVDIDRKPTDAQIRDSNRYLLESMVAAAHAQPVLLGVARDDRSDLKAKIEKGLQADALCITGGISMGAFDYVPDVLEECGATFRFRKIAIKPGRPTIFATAPDAKPIFALPGNPGGALVGFVLLVKPAIAAMQGGLDVLPNLISTKLAGTVRPIADRRTYLPAMFKADPSGQREVHPLPWHGSGDTFGLAGADALIMRPPRAQAASQGDNVATIALNRT